MENRDYQKRVAAIHAEQMFLYYTDAIRNPFPASEGEGKPGRDEVRVREKVDKPAGDHFHLVIRADMRLKGRAPHHLFQRAETED